MITFFALFLAWASPGPDAFNSALASGDLPAADLEIRAIIAGGARTADVYYNLGNVRYRQERLPEAMLAWQCAAALAPRDPDVAANLDVARRKLTDRYEVAPKAPIWAPWQRALTPDEGQWIGAAIAGLALVALAFGGSKTRLPAAGFSGVGLWIALGGLAAAARLPIAVVQTATKATSDLGGGSTLFTLGAGAEVRVVDQGGGQLLIGLPDGRRGWLAASTVALADPETGCLVD